MENQTRFYGYGYRIINDWTLVTEVMMMVVPEAWEKHQTMSDDKKSILRYNACIMELGMPCSIPFTDGNVIGAL
jgi:glutamate synthase domain-containing protein 1